MPLISVVTPVYGAADIVKELYLRLVKNLSLISDDFEIIMVNDACPQGSGKEIEKLAHKDNRVKLIDFTRNFGQHTAITAGIDYAEGEYVVVMDCDLQDPPEEIINLFNTLKDSGKEVCFALRKNRKDGFLKKAYSRIFGIIMRLLTDKIFYDDKDHANFSIITKKAVLELRRLKELNRNYSSLIRWCGFEFTYIEVEMQERFAGTSSYTFIKSIKHALNVLLQQSVKPLFISSFFSIGLFLTSCVFAGIIFYNSYAGNYSVAGWASTMFAITFISSMLFLTLAVISVYIANIFQGQHQRPLYVVNRTLNVKKEL